MRGVLRNALLLPIFLLLGAGCLDGDSSSITRGPVPTASPTPNLAVSPSSLALVASSLSRTPPSATVTVTADDGSSVDVVVSADASWVTLDQASGTTPWSVRVGADPAGLPPGTVEASITFRSETAGPVTMTVALTVAPPSWSPTGGPFGGVVAGFAWESPATAYLAAWNGGVWSTLDGGSHWGSIGLEGEAVQTVALCGASGPPTLFAALYGTGIAASNDRGSTWFSPLPGAAPGSDLLALACGEGAVYAGSQSGVIWSSFDGGGSWSAAAGFPGEAVYALGAASAGGLVAGTSTGVRVWDPAAGVWRVASGGVSGLSILSLAEDPLHPGRWLAGSYGAGIYASPDGGLTWSGPAAGSEGLTVQGLSFDPMRTGGVVAATWAGPRSSLDSGTTWSGIGTAIDDLAASAGPGGTALVGGNGAGAFASFDGGASWGSIATVAASTVYALAFPSAATLWAATYGNGLFRSTDGGDAWDVVASPGVDLLALWVNPADGDRLVLSVDGSGLFASGDGGRSWSPVAGLGAGSVYALAGRGPTLFAGSYDAGVWRSDDGGTTWVASSGDLPAAPIWVLGVAGDGTVYAGTDGDGLYRSTDGGGRWTAVGSFTSVQALAFEGGTIVVGTWGDGIWVSNDGGETFSSAGAPGENINGLLASGNALEAGGDRGIWESLDGGSSWRTKGAGLPRAPVWSLAADPALSGRLLAGTDGASVVVYQ